MGLGSVTFAHSLSVNHPPLRQAQVPVFVSFVSFPPIYAYYGLSCCLPHPDWLCLSALFPQKPSSSLWGSGVGFTRHVHPLDMSRAIFLKKPIPKVLWVLDPAASVCKISPYTQCSELGAFGCWGPGTGRPGSAKRALASMMGPGDWLCALVQNC